MPWARILRLVQGNYLQYNIDGHSHFYHPISNLKIGWLDNAKSNNEDVYIVLESWNLDRDEVIILDVTETECYHFFQKSNGLIMFL